MPACVFDPSPYWKWMNKSGHMHISYRHMPHAGLVATSFCFNCLSYFFLLCFLHIWYRLCWCKTIAVFLLWQLHVILAATTAMACDFQLNKRSTCGDTSLERLIEDIWTWVVTGTPEALLFKCSFFSQKVCTWELPHAAIYRKIQTKWNQLFRYQPSTKWKWKLDTSKRISN